MKFFMILISIMFTYGANGQENIITQGLQDEAMRPYRMPVNWFFFTGDINYNLRNFGNQVQEARGIENIFSDHFSVFPALDSQKHRYKRVLRLSNSNEADEKGFLVTEKRAVNTGIGIFIAGGKVGWRPMVPYFFAGIMPFNGKQVYVERFIKTLEKTKKMKSPKLPHSVESLKDYHVGDRIYYSKKGGVLLELGFSFQEFDNAIQIIAQGLWNVDVKKVDESKVEATVSKGRVNGISLRSGLIFFGDRYDNIKERIRQYSFEFDLSDEVAKEAYIKFIGGNISHTQRLIATQAKGIKSIFYRKILNHDTANSFMAGFPFLYRYTSSQFTRNSSIDDYRENIQEEKYYVASKILEQKSTGPLAKKFTRSKRFTAMYIKSESNKEDRSFDKYGATYLWSYEREKTDLLRVKREFNRLRLGTGIEIDLDYEEYNLVRDRLSRYKTLGYAHFEVELAISKAATDSLMNWSVAEELDQLAVMNDQVDLYINNYWADKTRGNQICRRLKLRNCKQSILKNTKQYVAKAVNALRDMYSTKQQGKFKQFINHYNRFGQYLTQSRFTFQVLYRSLLKKNNTHLLYKGIGENIPRVEIKLP